MKLEIIAWKRVDKTSKEGKTVCSTNLPEGTIELTIKFLDKEEST